ncbi:unnamed protein product [Caenorhabditis nigoni]
MKIYVFLVFVILVSINETGAGSTEPVTLKLALSPSFLSNPNTTLLEERRLAAALLPKPNRYVVFYNATLTCPLPKFCATIYYFEHDYLSYQDHLVYVGLSCTRTNRLHHQAMALVEGGDEQIYGYRLTQNYQPKIQVFHDCKGPGQTRLFEKRLPELEIDAPNFQNGTALYTTYEAALSTDDLKFQDVSMNWYETWFNYPWDSLTYYFQLGRDVTPHKQLFRERFVYWEPVKKGCQPQVCVVADGKRTDVCENNGQKTCSPMDNYEFFDWAQGPIVVS